MVSAWARKDDVARYGALLEDIFRLGLTGQKIPFHSVSHDIDGKGIICVNVVIPFSPNLPDLERFIKSQLIVDEKRSGTLGDDDSGSSPSGAPLRERPFTSTSTQRWATSFRRRWNIFRSMPPGKAVKTRAKRIFSFWCPVSKRLWRPFT
jgi:hypothetical protein